MARLALKLAPQTNETIMSFVSRLAAKNGPSFVQDFCMDLGLKWQKLIYSDADQIKRLADFINVDPNELMQRALVGIDRRRCELNGQLLATRSFLRREQKLCPECVQMDEQDGGRFGVFGRREWLLAPFRVCPIHRCQLLILPRVIFPRHPADFFRRYENCRELIIRGREKPNANRSSNWETYLLQRLSGITHQRWIDYFDLDAAMRIVQGFGIVAVYGPSAREADLSSEELSRACHAGFLATSGDEVQFSSAMNCVYEKSDSQKPGFFIDFGMFARWCSRVSEDERYRPLIDVVTKFTFENYPVSKGEVLCGRVCHERKWHNCSSAALEYGSTNTRMSKLIEVFELGVKKPGKVRVFRAEEAEKILPDVLRCIPRTQCFQRLGTHPSLFDQIVDRKFLKPKYNVPQVVPLYDPDDIDSLLSNIRVQTRSVAAPSEGTLDIKSVCNAAKCQFEDILRKILSGELTTTQWIISETGLRALRFKLEDVRDVLEAEPTSDLTRSDVRSLMCVNQQTVKMLIDSKKLKSRLTRHHRNRRPMHVVKKSEVEKFLSKYVSLGELAKKAGIQANWVAVRLAKDDIHPISFPPDVSKLYYREVVDAYINQGSRS